MAALPSSKAVSYYLHEDDRGLVYAALLESARQYRDMAKEPLMVQHGLAEQFTRQAGHAERLAERFESAETIEMRHIVSEEQG